MVTGVQTCALPILERGPRIALQAMQEKKALSWRGRGRLRPECVTPDWCLTGLSSAIACSSELEPRPTWRSAPQLEETPETPPSSPAEGLLFLHGLESNPGSSLQTEEEAGLP